MKIFFFLTLLLPVFLNAQSFYVVQDSDGYVNARTGPGIEFDIVEEIMNKTVVKEDTSLFSSNGWIPIEYIGNNGNPVYIFRDRLIPISKNIGKKLDAINKVESYAYSKIYMMSLEHPNIYIISEDCETVVMDIKNDKILLATGIPVCFNIIWEDTLSFYTLFDFGFPLLPAFVQYKLGRDEKGNYFFYTEIKPEPIKIPLKQAQENIQEIKDRLKGVDTYMISEAKIGKQIMESYIAGVEDAEDILKRSTCDASICHDIASYLSFIEAYKLSKLKQKNVLI